MNWMKGQRTMAKVSRIDKTIFQNLITLQRLRRDLCIVERAIEDTTFELEGLAARKEEISEHIDLYQNALADLYERKIAQESK